MADGKGGVGGGRLKCGRSGSMNAGLTSRGATFIETRIFMSRSRVERSPYKKISKGRWPAVSNKGNLRYELVTKGRCEKKIF